MNKKLILGIVLAILMMSVSPSAVRAEQATAPSLPPEVTIECQADFFHEWLCQMHQWYTANSPSPLVSPIQTPSSVAESVAQITYMPFTPDWTGLSAACPSQTAFLKAHRLNANQVIFHPARSVTWEPCQYVVELKPAFYGKVTIPLMDGWAYTLAPVNQDVVDMWGGDPNVVTMTLQWGFTARWAPTYQSLPYKWLLADNPCEWVVRDWRFGRYWRLPDLGLTPPEVPYYDRVGPYTTMPGNVDCLGWVPPELDQTVPNNYLQATAMLGGLANSNEWKHSADKLNWAWRYSQKVAGSGTYCPRGMPCWQTTYIPPDSFGYIELWSQGGAQKFYAEDLAKLMLGNMNVDEFTYHADPNK